MPGMDGLQLFEWLLEHQAELARHFLFITGDAGSHHLNRKIESFGVPVLRKPFQIETLLSECRRLIKADSVRGSGSPV